MVKKLLFFFVILVSAQIGQGQTISKLNAAGGFRTVKLNTSLGQHPDLFFESFNKKGYSVYNKENENMDLGFLKADDIRYWFDNDQLHKITIDAEHANRLKVINYYKSLYGRPTEYTENGRKYYKWNGKEIYLLVEFTKIKPAVKEKVEISFISKAAIKETSEIRMAKK